MSSGKQFSIKLYIFNSKNIRRFAIGNATIPATYEGFVAVVKQILASDFNTNEDFSLKYEDNEKDWITVGSDAEWKEMLKLHNNNDDVIRIKVGKKDGAKAPAPQPAAQPQQQAQAPKQDATNADDKKNNFGIENLQQGDVVVDITEALKNGTLDNVLSSLQSDPSNVSQQFQAVHHRVTCDGCGMKPIVGPRYKCNACDDFDYCHNCHETFKKSGNSHNAKHSFKVIPYPKNMPYRNIVTHVIYEDDSKPQQVPQPQPQAAPAPAPAPAQQPAEVKQEQAQPAPSAPASAPAPQPAQPTIDTEFIENMKALREMGFNNAQQNFELLRKYKNINRVVDHYLSQ